MDSRCFAESSRIEQFKGFRAHVRVLLAMTRDNSFAALGGATEGEQLMVSPEALFERRS